MSVRIRVSYERPEELQKVLKLLSPEIKRWRKAGQQDGKYKKAYVDIKAE